MEIFRFSTNFSIFSAGCQSICLKPLCRRLRISSNSDKNLRHIPVLIISNSLIHSRIKNWETKKNLRRREAEWIWTVDSAIAICRTEFSTRGVPEESSGLWTLRFAFHFQSRTHIKNPLAALVLLPIRSVGNHSQIQRFRFSWKIQHWYNFYKFTGWILINELSSSEIL